jgi:hypothetical protein
MLGFVFNRYYHFTTDWDPERLTTDVVSNVDNLLRHNPFPHLPSLHFPLFLSSFGPLAPTCANPKLWSRSTYVQLCLELVFTQNDYSDFFPI